MSPDPPAAAEPGPGRGPGAPSDDDLTIHDGAVRYRAYSAQVRNTARWVIGALAVVAGVLFGAGPVLDRPELSWSDDAGQLLVAGLLGVIGLSGICYVIWTIAQLFLPHEVTLATLPPELVRRIDDDPDHRSLPGGLGLHTVDQFRRALIASRRALRGMEALIDQKESAARIATGDTKQALTAEVETMKTALERNRAGLAVLEDFRSELIERGTYILDRGMWSRLERPLRDGAALAVIGIIGFPLALSTAPADEDDDAGGSSSPSTVPQVTTMTQVPGAAGEALWAALSLAGCESSEGVVPVLLTGGHGTESDPYDVQTLASPTCEPTAFTVVSEVAVVDVSAPVEATITYRPATGG